MVLKYTYMGHLYFPPPPLFELVFKFISLIININVSCDISLHFHILTFHKLCLVCFSLSRTYTPLDTSSIAIEKNKIKGRLILKDKNLKSIVTVHCLKFNNKKEKL